MSTIEDFKNAPIGATATHDDGRRAMKMGDVERRWIFPSGRHTDDEEMAEEGYTLDLPAPTTAREALDLAWDLAHEVKEGQVILKGTPYLMKDASGLMEHTTLLDNKILPELVPIFRTLEPLPEPEPDWLNAPAVLAKSRNWTVPGSQPQVFTRDHESGLEWLYNGSEKPFHWSDLTDVTPLYPKEKE